MKDLSNLNNWTKNALARVILQALLNADKSLPADHFRVKRMVNANKKTVLVNSCQHAINQIDRNMTHRAYCLATVPQPHLN
jgi:hypothetical protein